MSQQEHDRKEDTDVVIDQLVYYSPSPSKTPAAERDVRVMDGRLTDDDHPDPCQRTESGPRIYVLSCKSQREV